MPDDTVQVRCTRCRSNFREKAHRLQPGHSKQCPHCEVIVFFEEGSSDKNVQQALLDARRLRRALREADEMKLVVRRAPVYDRSS